MSLPTMSGTARLIADPELRVAPSGTFIATVRLAFNSRRKNDAGEWVDGDVFYVNGTLFRDEAEHVAESLTKGTEVVVTGRLKTRKYTDKDNQPRSVVELMVDSIGPTLRWTTVKVAKMTRKSDGGTPLEDPWQHATSAASSADAYDDEAPPF